MKIINLVYSKEEFTKRQEDEKSVKNAKNIYNASGKYAGFFL